MKNRNKLHNVRWLVPQKHTLNTPKECKQLLKDGFVLINNEGYTVHLGLDGVSQLRSNLNRKRPYKFSNPQLWQVLNQEATETAGYVIVYNTSTLWFKIYRTISRIANKIL